MVAADKQDKASHEDGSQTLEWIDVHTHLNFLKCGVEEALERGRAAGVSRYITIGTEPKDHETVLELAQRHAPSVWCTLGVHPHEAKLYTEAVGDWIREKARAGASRVVAIGETGLDYHYNSSPQDVQIWAFRQQMEIAAELNLPVEIHTRDAETDTQLILREYQGRVRGLLHCFTGTMNLARQALDFGFDISISGVATFKNAHDLRDVVRFVPLDRLHVETDAPFLAPVPVRGQSNEPSFVVHTARLVASLKSVELRVLSQQTADNAARLFPRLLNT